MNTAELLDDVVSTDDNLMKLQLQVARRADELARSRGTRKINSDWGCWFEAEKEVLGREVMDPKLSAGP